MIRAAGLALGYHGRAVLEGIDLSVAPGEIVAIIGANGSGKSTLLRALAGLHPVSRGVLEINRTPMARWSRRALARHVAYLTQSPAAPEGVTVAELVAHGAFAQGTVFRRADPGRVADALTMTGLGEFADRPFATLSGGEQQRAWIALTLMQDTKMLLLDEPTSALDIGFQLEILDLLQHLRQDRGLGVVFVIHDVNMASRSADRIVALKGGGILADGPPRTVIRSEVVEALFGTRMTVLQDHTGAHPFCVPHGRLSKDDGPEAGAPPIALVKGAAR